MRVWIREEGVYENAHVVAVYASLKAAKAAVEADHSDGPWEWRLEEWLKEQYDTEQWEYQTIGGEPHSSNRCRRIAATLSPYDVL